MCDRGRSHSKVPGRCRACSTAECTATNIVIAPIAHAHRTAPHSCSLLLLLLPASAPTARSHAAHSRAARSSLTLPSLLLPAPAPCSCSHCSLSHSCSLHLQLPFRLWHSSRTFLSTTCAGYSIFRLCFSALSLAPWTLPLLV